MSPKSRRRALIVTSSEFEDPTFKQLTAPGNDADALAVVLADPEIGDFQVETLANLPYAELRREIERFYRQGRSDDLLLLYFSCHGVTDDARRLYFVTTDTERDLLLATAISDTFVHKAMIDSRSRRHVLILDCCYSGAFVNGMSYLENESAPMGKLFQTYGRDVLASSTALQYSFVGDEIRQIGAGNHSLFTNYLVDGLKSGQADLDGDGWISSYEIYKYVSDKIAAKTSDQTPVISLQGFGDMHIASSPSSSALAAVYEEATKALEARQLGKAKRLFKEVVDKQPDYRDAALQAVQVSGTLIAVNAAKENQALVESLEDNLFLMSYLEEAKNAGLDLEKLQSLNLGTLLEQIVYHIVARDGHSLSCECGEELSTEDLCHLLSYLGLNMFWAGATSYPVADAVGIVREALNEIEMDSYDDEQVLGWLESTYWFQKTEDDGLAFRDPYVVDVFAALGLKKSISSQSVSTIFGQIADNPTRWQEPLGYLIGMLSKEDATLLSEYLLEQGLISLAGHCVIYGWSLPRPTVAHVVQALLIELAGAEQQ